MERTPCRTPKGACDTLDVLVAGRGSFVDPSDVWLGVDGLLHARDALDLLPSSSVAGLHRVMGPHCPLMSELPSGSSAVLKHTATPTFPPTQKLQRPPRSLMAELSRSRSRPGRPSSCATTGCWLKVRSDRFYWNKRSDMT